MMIFGVIGICLIIIVLHFFGLTKFGESQITKAMSKVFWPVREAGMAISDFFRIYLQRGEAAEENEKYRQKIIELANDNVRLRGLEEENEILRKELQFTTSQNNGYVISRVMGSDMNYDNSVIIIDKGENDGLKAGLPVTAEGGVMIGLISKTEDRVSLVRLLNDNNSKISVLVKADMANLGMLEGDRNLNLKIDILPREAVIKERELVSTAGLEKDIPAGLIIGEINQVNNDSSIWQTALVDPLVDYERLRIVTVILPL